MIIQSSTEEAVSRYGPMVYRMAYAQTRSRPDADDVFQEVFLRFHRAAPSFQSQEHEKAWLLRVTINCTRNFFTASRKSANQKISWDDWDNLEDASSRANPEVCAVQDALFQLPPKYRAVIHLYYYEGYQTDEIAKILHRRPSTVRTQLTRARQKLSDLLKEDLGENLKENLKED